MFLACVVFIVIHQEIKSYLHFEERNALALAAMIILINHEMVKYN